MAVGMYGYVAVGVESSGGTASHSVTPVEFLPFTTEAFTQDKTTLDSGAITGIVDVLHRCDGPDNIGGSITVEIQPTTIGYLLRSWFDSTTVSVGSNGAASWQSYVDSSADAVIHQFKAGANQFQVGSGSDVPTLTFHKHAGPSTTADSAFAFYQMAANTMELTFDVGNFNRATFDFVGRKAGRSAALTITTPEQICMTGVQTSVSIAGVGNASFETITIRGNNALDPKFLLNGSANAELLRRTNFRTVEISGTMAFQDHTQVDLFLASTKTEMVINVAGDTDVASGFPFALQATAPSFRYTANNPQIQGPGFITVPFQGVAEYNTGSGTALQVLVVNSRANSYNVNSTG